MRSISLQKAAVIGALALSMGNAYAVEQNLNGEVITGKMSLDFQTHYQRTSKVDEANKRAINTNADAEDIYKIDGDNPLTIKLSESDKAVVKGTVVGKPLNKGFLGIGAQNAGYNFGLNIYVVNKKYPTPGILVGNWSGFNTVDKNGIYNPDDSSGKFAITSTIPGAAPVAITGTIVGKTPDTVSKLPSFVEALKANSSTVYQYVNGKVQATSLTGKTDPLSFRNLKFSSGPVNSVFTEATFNGDLTYQYSTGNWYPSKLTMTYYLPSTKTLVTKAIGGTITYDSGKDQYVFNLLLNDVANAQSLDDEINAASGAKAQDVGSLDDELAQAGGPALIGTLDFHGADGRAWNLKGSNGEDLKDESGQPVSVTETEFPDFHIAARDLKPQEVTALFRMLMISIGPMLGD